MHNPIVGDNWLKKSGRLLIDFCEQWWVKHIARPFVFLLPPMLVTNVATRSGFQQQLAVLLGEKISGFVQESALLIIIGAYVYVTLLKGIYAAIEHYSKPERELGRKECIAILSALNTVVSEKCRRFGDNLKRSKICNNQNASNIFFQITCPDQQIALLIEAVRTVFSYLDETNALFRVGILSIKNDRAEEWLAFSPTSHPPRTLPSELCAPSSCVSYAIKTKSIVVIQDIQKELSKRTKNQRRFMKGNTQRSDQGSQLCFPIIHPSSSSVEYVLTIAGNKKDCLIEKHAELYAWVLEHFVLRLSLEHNLILLKEIANESERKAA